MTLKGKDGELYIALKLEPNVTQFIEKSAKNNSVDTDILNLKNFISGSGGVWANTVMKYIRDYSMEAIGKDISDWFELSKTTSVIKTVKPNNFKVGSGSASASDYNDVYESAVIKLKASHSFFTGEPFGELMTIVKSIYFNPDLMVKTTFTFNNRNNCICIYNGEKNMFYISEKSKRYLTDTEKRDCAELIRYLNGYLSDYLK